jgi:TonB family protein
VKMVPPVYPEEAAAKKVRGVVRFHVVVGETGKVEQVQLVAGDPLLTRAAFEAVKQWRYEPQPEAVDVEFDIDVDVKPTK